MHTFAKENIIMARDRENTHSTEKNRFQELEHSDNQDDFTAAVQLSASRILLELHLEEERTEEILGKIEADPLFQELKNSWEDLTPGERTEKWQKQLDLIVQAVYSSRPYCMRCGDCCSRVSPSLHHEDLHLFDNDFLSFRDVYTLRKGEPVLNNIKGSLDNLSQELIKVKESSEDSRCIFYDEMGKACRIYDKRPLQCRTQECWNPDPLEELWERKKLTRRDFIKEDRELLDLLQVHDQRCSPDSLDKAIKKYWETGETSDLDPVVNMLSQDMIIRKFFVEKMGRSEEELDFLLGRPLAKVIEAYKLNVEQDADGTYHLIEVE